MIIANISYFVGYLWYIYCDILRESEFAAIARIWDNNLDRLDEIKIEIESFQENFGMDQYIIYDE